MRFPIILLSLFAALVSGGCLYMQTSNEVVRDQEPKRVVAFQSESAARLFQKAVDRKRKTDGAAQVKEFCIPLVCCLCKTWNLAEAAFYNDQLAVCDTDGDGFITDAEAAAYDRTCGLVQTGHFAVSSFHGPYEIRYPRPYASPPELTFPNGDSGVVDQTRLEETARGFRVYLAAWTSSSSVSWCARGVPARDETERVPPATLGAPAAQLPAQPVAPAGAGAGPTKS